MLIRLLKRLKEIINTFFYDNRSRVLRLMRSLTLAGGVAALFILIYYHGFPISPERKALLFEVLKVIFVIFILNFFSRLFFTFSNWKFLKENWLEGVLISLLVVDIVSYYVFQIPLLRIIFEQLGFENFYGFYIIFIQCYILLLILLETLKLSRDLLNFAIKPAWLLIGAFGLMILGGTGLLLLPEMTVQDGAMPFLDAFFTATSAVCVTGLIVVDTATYFTFKGHFILLLLIQAGGIGIVSFATFFVSFLKSGVGIKQQAAVKDFLQEESLYNTVNLMRQIILYTFTIELMGIIAIYLLWEPGTSFTGPGDKLFSSIFHAVSAFCNAGFALFTNSFYESHLRHSYLLHVVLGVLIVLGGLGFPALRDLFGIENLRNRMREPWRKWKTSTQIAVYASTALIVFGAGLFYLLEASHAMQSYNIIEGVITATFQSVTARTAGFNTVDISALATPALLLLVFLMFIGGSSGSTAGGIKTSTFVVIIMSALATIRGQDRVELGRKTISNELLYKAFSIFSFSVLFIFTSFFILTLTEGDHPLIVILFEAVSAFSIVGLSAGLTPELTDIGKTVIIISMFIGRLGPLTLAFAMSSQSRPRRYKYPETNVVVG